MSPRPTFTVDASDPAEQAAYAVVFAAERAAAGGLRCQAPLEASAVTAKAADA
jgi:hypothetical protein